MTASTASADVPAARGGAPSHPAAAPPYILVVDDAAVILESVRAMLEPRGYDLGLVRSGAEALGNISARIPDLILLDVMMEDSNGFEVCHRLRSITGAEAVPVIFLTALADVENVVRGFREGAVDYITKPFHSEELVARVETHLALRSARRDLEARNRELEDVIRMRDQLYAVLAHDLKNPLSVVAGIAKRLDESLESGTPEERRGLVYSLKDAGDQGMALLDELQLWAAVQAGLTSGERWPTDLGAAVHRAIAAVTPAAKQKRIAIAAEASVACRVLADKESLTAVFRNLLSNAVKFSHSGTCVTVRAARQHGTVKCRVEDKGVGIAEEDLPRLFDMRSRFTLPGTGGEKGTGLGLVLCREFIERAGGMIDVQSHPGEGSVFRVTLLEAAPERGAAASGHH